MGPNCALIYINLKQCNAENSSLFAQAQGGQILTYTLLCADITYLYCYVLRRVTNFSEQSNNMTPYCASYNLPAPTSVLLVIALNVRVKSKVMTFSSLPPPKRQQLWNRINFLHPHDKKLVSSNGKVYWGSYLISINYSNLPCKKQVPLGRIWSQIGATINWP